MANPHEGRPPHPQYGAPLSGLPRLSEGVTFRPYRIGVSRNAWISDDWRIEVRDKPFNSTLIAVLDGEVIGRNYRLFRTAVAAAVKAIRTANSVAPREPRP